MGTATQRGRHATRMMRALALVGLIASASLTAVPESVTVRAQSESTSIAFSTGESYVQVGGFFWPGDDVLVTVDDPTTEAVEVSFDPVTPENGQFSLEQQGIQAYPGWVVTATDETTTKTLDVVDFTIDRVDTSDGRVEGTATPGTVLELIANGPDPDSVVNVTANAAGAWNTVLPLPLAGADLSAHYIDGDGDFMGYSYRWPSIFLMLSDDVDEDGTVRGILLTGSNWPTGVTVHMVVDDPADAYDREFDFDVTEWGELDHWALGETGIPNGVVGDGWTVTATTTFDGWTTTKTHDVATVRVNETDHVAGTASGVCPAGRPETWVGTVSGRWPGQGGSSMQVDCADGTWTFEWEVDQFDIPLVTVGLRDGDWDGTSFLNFQDRPQVYHDAATGTVTFIYWNGEDVEVLLDGAPLTTIPHPGEQWYRTTLEQHGVPSSDITPGATITFQTSTELKTMVVEPVTIDTIDQDGTAHGTAAADAEVMVGVANADRFGGPAEFEVTMADGDGNWSAQLPPEAFPLDFDHVVRATVLDYDDDANIAEFVPTPQIVVRPTDDVVVALGFQQGEMVTVTVDDDQDPDNGVLFAVDREIQDPRQAHLELYDEETGEDWDVVAGEVVTVAGESGFATHVVTELTATGAEANADVVTGRATAGSEVVVNVNDEPIWRVVTAEPDGTWIADFAVEPVDPEFGGGVADLQPGSEGQAEQYDDAGNATGATWRVPNPTLEVDPFEDIVTLNEVLPGTDVEILVNGFPTGSGTAAPWGNSYWEAGAQVDVYPTVDVSAGDVVEAIASTGEVVTTLISPLTVDGSDIDVQMLTGTANPGAEVFVHAGSDDSDAQRNVTADETGRWTADFATEPEPGEEGQEPPGYGTVDLASMRWLDVAEHVGDGGTTIYRRDERPSLFAFPAEGAIWSFNWYPLDPVDLTISNDSGVAHEVSGLVPEHGPSPTTIGDVTFDLPEENPRASIVYQLPAGIELHPGDRVTMSDALMTVTGEVGEVTVDEANLLDETLSGTTAADSAFLVAFDAEGHIGAVEPVDGTWTTPLCTPDPLGGCDGIDLTHGSAGVVLAFPREESIDETGTAATWSMAPRILSIDAPATAALKTETTVVVTVADIERPDVQSVTIDWGEKKNDNDKDTSIAWLSDPDVPTDLEFTHTYKVKGTVTVTVTMTDAWGSSTTQTFPIEITKR